MVDLEKRSQHLILLTACTCFPYMLFSTSECDLTITFLVNVERKSKHLSSCATEVSLISLGKFK